MSETYSITSKPFYDSQKQCYKKVLALDRKPGQPLINISKKVVFNKLSAFQQHTECERYNPCGYVLMNPENICEYAIVDDLPKIFSWLFANKYTVDTSITQMLNQSNVKYSNPLICMITKQN